MTGRTAGPAAYEAAEAAWGDSEPKPDVWTLGPWTLERRGDELADIGFDGTPLLRMIRAVVRDRDWNTVPVSVEAVEQTRHGLRLDLRFEGFGALFSGSLTVGGHEDRLEFRLALEALQDFERNRIGLVVLHPPAVAGAELAVTAPGGVVTRTRFPDHIAPHQPALDIAALGWSAGGVAGRLEFSGDVFEMEDQRNWTDASFKTYSTPLGLPFPVLVRAGERVVQAITLRASRVAPAPVQQVAASVSFRGADRAVPQLAVGASTSAGDAPAAARTAPGSAVLVELVAATPTWRAALARAVEEAAGRPLDVRLVASDATEVDEVLDALSEADAEVRRLGVFSPHSQITEPELWAALRGGADRRGLGAELLGGARSHFTELNRRHQDLPADLPALTFSITPQMHATERSQLVESIAMQRLVAEDAVRIAAGRPVHIGPVTLRARYNAVATTAPVADGDSTVTGGYGAELVPTATDPRQRSAAAAAWTVASAAALAIPGVTSLTYFESWGPRGVLDAAGAAYPVAQALRALAELAGAPQLEVDGLPEHVWGIAAGAPGGNLALLANLRPEPVRLEVDGTGPVELGPLSFARVPLAAV